MQDIATVCNAGARWGSGKSGFGELYKSKDTGMVIGRLRGTKHVTAPDSLMAYFTAASGFGLPLAYKYHDGTELVFRVDCKADKPTIRYWVDTFAEYTINGAKAKHRGLVIDDGVITKRSIICACCSQ